MLIRDTVTAQERLSGLQPKYTKNRPFNRREVRSKSKKHTRYAENTQLFSKNLGII